MDNTMMVSKEEKEDTVLQLDLMENNVVDSDRMTDLEDACQGGLTETSTEAVAVHLNLEDFGNFKYKVQSTRFCQYSPYTGWHLKRNEVMNITSTTRSNKLRPRPFGIIEGPLPEL